MDEFDQLLQAEREIDFDIPIEGGRLSTDLIKTRGYSEKVDIPQFKPLSLSELMEKQFGDSEWIVENLIPAEGIIAISGSPSSYKTWLILDIAIKVAEGEILFDRFVTNRTGVLIIDEETGDRWLQKRIQKMQDKYDLPIYLLSKTGYKLTKEGVESTIAFAKDHGIGLIVFDSFVRIHLAKDENSAVEMARVFSLLQEFTKGGITVIFTHHNRKPGILRSSNLSQDMRGSSDILAAVDSHIAVERKDEYLVITQTKLRQGEEIPPFKLNIINDDEEFRFEYAGELDELKTKKIEIKKAIKEILENEAEPLYKKELFNKLVEAGIEGGYTTFKVAMQEMAENGELFEQKGERNKVYCSLKPFGQQQGELDV